MTLSPAATTPLLLFAAAAAAVAAATAAGSDPPGIKLRAAKALEAVDYFVPGYWVFSKMVQSLADIGYDNNNLVRKPCVPCCCC